ncbi:hypothetical protein ACFLUU_01365 [Chloroflexota bacterium]
MRFACSVSLERVCYIVTIVRCRYAHNGSIASGDGRAFCYCSNYGASPSTGTYHADITLPVTKEHEVTYE